MRFHLRRLGAGSAEIVSLHSLRKGRRQPWPASADESCARGPAAARLRGRIISMGLVGDWMRFHLRRLGAGSAEIVSLHSLRKGRRQPWPASADESRGREAGGSRVEETNYFDGLGGGLDALPPSPTRSGLGGNCESSLHTKGSKAAVAGFGGRVLCARACGSRVEETNHFDGLGGGLDALPPSPTRSGLGGNCESSLHTKGSKAAVAGFGGRVLWARGGRQQG
jgi:hypothetical protein